MIERATMLNSLLLDANIVIEAYKLGVWDGLLDKRDIVVPSIVAHDEARFCRKDENAIPEAIDLSRLIGLGRIREESATRSEMKTLMERFDAVFIQGLHEGELEALAIISEEKIDDVLFCTSDKVAIQALVMINHSGLGISMEKLLQVTGFPKRLDRQFTEAFFQEWVKKGEYNLITGQGLRSLTNS